MVAIIAANHKCCTLTAVKTKCATEVPPILMAHWRVYGRFEELGSDHGGEFTAKVITEFEKMEGIRGVKGMVYTPEHQGRIERHNRMTKYRLVRDLYRIEVSEGKQAAADR